MGEGTVGIGIRRPMRGLGIAASGLSAQRARMNVIAANIANAETTQGVDGAPYRRRTVALEEVAFQPLLGATGGAVVGKEGGGVRIVGVQEDTREGPLVYDPGHPDADENGYVRMPNVDINQEMVDMMEVRRLFEANVSVFQAIKTMLRRAAQL
ncbi:MAG: flagellar basal body rod protein FlgC [Gemmatimonadota bacterium]